MIKLYSILVYFFLTLSVFGQKPIHYTMDDGLPSNHVYDIAQDSEGYMWFGTNRGLVKFDGSSFRTFTIGDGLPNNDVWGLEADDQGRIWYISKSKFQGYIKNDSIYKFATKDSLELSPALFFYNNHKMNLIATSSKRDMDSQMEFKNNQIIPSEIIQNFKKYNWLHNPSRIRSVLQLIPINENLCIMQEDSISIINLKPESVKSIIKKPKKVSDRKNSIRIYNDYFIYLNDEGITIINHHNYNHKTLSYKDLCNVDNFSLYCMRKSKNGLQISVPGYLFEFDHNLELQNTITLSKSIPNHSSFKDIDGNLWIIDINNGISMLTAAQLETEYYFKNQKTTKITNIKDTIYLGIDNDYFYKLDYDEKLFRRIAKASGKIYGINENSNNICLNSSLSNYISEGTRFKFTQLKFKYRKEIEVYNINSYKTFYEYKGINYYLNHLGITPQYLNNETSADLIKIPGILCLELHDDHIYIGGIGLHYIHNNKLIDIPFEKNLQIPSINVLRSKNDTLYIGTNGNGIYTLINNEISSIKQSYDFNIHNIIIHDNFIWCGSNNGVHKLSIDTTNIINSQIIDTYNTTDGLLLNNINDIAIIDSTLFITTDIGLSKINLNNPLYKNKPNIKFDYQTDTMNIKWSSNMQLPISFSLIDYSNKKSEIQYRLIPSHNNWITTNTNTINISNLSPDIYSIQIRATDHHQNQKTISLWINIIPCWYQTTISRISFTIIFISFIVFIFIYISKQKLKLALIETNKERHIIELELQALRSKMSPSFIKHSIQVIEDFIDKNQIELSEIYLIKFSKMIRHFFDYAKKQNTSLNNEIRLLDNYLQIERLRLGDSINYQIITDPILDLTDIYIPTILLHPIIEKIIIEISEHKPTKTVLNIYIERLNTNILSIEIAIQSTLKENSSTKYTLMLSDEIIKKLNLLNKNKKLKISYSTNNNKTNLKKIDSSINFIFKYAIN